MFVGGGARKWKKVEGKKNGYTWMSLSETINERKYTYQASLPHTLNLSQRW